MYQPFDTIGLPTGETAEIGVAQAPEPGDPRRIGELLAHKGEGWGWHIAEGLDHALDGLETRYYLASIDGLAVSNVMTVEHAGVGILGHVFTRPEHRRQGLCKAIFGQLMPDFAARGGLRLTLGTGFDSAPYWIYHSFGFRGVLPETGFMKYEGVPDFAERWYAAQPAQVVPLAWRHWPTLAQFFCDDFGEGLQLASAAAFGPYNFEGPFLGLYRAVCDGAGPAVRVLEGANGAAVGVAMLRPDERWKGAVTLLDVLTHPAYAAHLPDLIAALPPVDRKVQAYLPAAATARCAALAAAGFRAEGRFTAQLPNGGDVVVYARG